MNLNQLVQLSKVINGDEKPSAKFFEDAVKTYERVSPGLMSLQNYIDKATAALFVASDALINKDFDKANRNALLCEITLENEKLIPIAKRDKNCYALLVRAKIIRGRVHEINITGQVKSFLFFFKAYEILVTQQLTEAPD